MSPKEKAAELLSTMSRVSYRFQPYAGANYYTEEVGYEAGKKCALACVKEILNARTAGNTGVVLDEEYWKEVEEELNFL